jgi:DnaK suppressor protein
MSSMTMPSKALSSNTTGKTTGRTRPNTTGFSTTTLDTDTSATNRQAELVERLPELRDLLQEQRRFRLDQLHQLTSQHVESQAETAARHVDTLDTSADNARVEVSAAVEAAAHQALDDIETALARMDAGRYGYCARCDQAIPVERLYAIPQAPLCMQCQRRAEYRR